MLFKVDRGLLKIISMSSTIKGFKPSNPSTVISHWRNHFFILPITVQNHCIVQRIRQESNQNKYATLLRTRFLGVFGSSQLIGLIGHEAVFTLSAQKLFYRFRLCIHCISQCLQDHPWGIWLLWWFRRQRFRWSLRDRWAPYVSASSQQKAREPWGWLYRVLQYLEQFHEPGSIYFNLSDIF